MSTKRILALICAAAMTLLLFTGCNADPAPADPSGTDPQATETALQLITPGVLKIGSEIGYPPFEYYDIDGTPIGLDIELGKEIADLLGLEVEYLDVDFNTILPGLNIDKYDLVMSSVTINPERLEIVDFSDPYIENWQSIITKKGSTPITSPAELEGKKITYQKGTTSFEFIEDMVDTGELNCTISEFDKVLQCFDELRLGRVDAVVCDSVVSYGYLAREEGIFELGWVQSAEADAEPEMFGIAVKKGNATLLEAVNGALAELEASGRLDEIRDDWLSKETEE